MTFGPRGKPRDMSWEGWVTKRTDEAHKALDAGRFGIAGSILTSLGEELMQIAYRQAGFTNPCGEIPISTEEPLK